MRRMLGRGGMGVVWEALDRKTGMLVALKTIQTPSANALYRLKKEFRLAQDLQHENLVALGELVEHEGSWFLTMELLEGVDFLTYVRGDYGSARTQSPDEPACDEERLVDALGQLLRALDALHGQDLVHRDVKPSNVMVTLEGRVVLLDFGLATVAAESMQSIGDNVVGTAHYMAPEQAAGSAVSPKADMYAVGAMLYEALAGRPPFEGTLLQVLMQKQYDVSIKPSEMARVAPLLEALCLDLLQSDPEQRPSPAKALSRLGLEVHQSGARSASQLLSEANNVFGREREWQALTDALERSRREGAQVVLVRGKSGLGKTTLIQAFCRSMAHEHEPAFVLSGRCYEREHTPYRGFDAVIDELARHLRQLPEAQVRKLLPHDAFVLTQLFPVLGRVPAIVRSRGGSDEGGDDQHRRTRAFEVLRSILNEISANTPLIVFVDDAQWADGDGATLLLDLLQGEDAPKVLWLLAAREDTSGDAAERPLVKVCAALDQRIETLEVKTLSEEASRHLARELMRRVEPKALDTVDAIVGEAQGHPLHIAELVQHAAHYGLRADRPPRLEDAIWARASGLPRDVVRVLTVICVAGAPVSADVVALAADIKKRACTRAMGMLRVAQLARFTPQGRVEPFHDRVRETVVQRLSPTELRELHARLVDLLESEPDHHDLLVHHLRALGDAERTTRLARNAAERAVQALAFDRAATLYRTALDMQHGSEADLRALQLGLARALMNMGRCAEAAEEFLGAAEGADPETRLDAQRLAAQQLITSGHVERGLEVASKLLSELGISHPKTPRAALVSLLYHRARLRMRGLAFQERRAGQITREQINYIEVLRAIGQGLALVDNIRGADFNARFLLRALELGDRHHVAQALGSEATYQGSQGKKALLRARNLSRTLQEISEDQKDPYYKAWSTSIAGALDHFEGFFERAEERQRKAIASFRARTTGYTWEVNSAITFRFFALKHMGPVTAIRKEFERELREAMRRGDMHIETSLRRYCTFLWLARDDERGAEENLSSSKWAPPEGRFHLQHWYELEARMELLLYTNAIPQEVSEVLAHFEPLEQSLLARVRSIRDVSTWLKARCLLALPAEVEPKRRLKLVESAARVLEQGGLCHAEAWACLLRGALHAARGETDKALASLATSAQIGDERGMRLVAAAARMRRGELLGGDEGRALCALGESAMRELGVVAPRKYLAVLAPGYAESNG
jgi:tetratricopeptide (TPR) repeat protein